MYLLPQLQRQQHCVKDLLESSRVQLHQLHPRMDCHGLQVADSSQLTLQVKDQTLQEPGCCYVVAVPLMSVGGVVKRVALMLLPMAGAQQDHL